MRNLKAFVFTVDAIFALIIASAATSLLLLTSYAPPVQVQGPITQSTSVSLNFLQSTLGEEAASIPLAAAAIDGWISSSYTWPQYGNNVSQSSSTFGFGPQYPFILFKYQTVNLINPAPVAADGLVVFTTNGPGSNLYAINATTGSLVFNAPDPWGGVFIGAPVIYNGRIYAVDSNGIVEAYTEHGSFLWGTQISGNKNLFLDAVNGYIEANMSFISSINGSALITSPTYQGVYTEGQYYSITPYNSIVSNFISYSLYGSSLQQLWSVKLAITSNAYFAPMAADPNYIYFSYYSGGGWTFNSYKPSNGRNWNSGILPNAVQGGPAIFGNATVFKTSNTLYGYTTFGGKSTFTTAFPTDLYSITPSATPNYVYIETGGNVLGAYNELSGSLVWNTTLPSGAVTLNANTLPADIAIAYGNAYVVSGNVLYAIGTCKADPRSSMLQAIATLYLNGGGGCAALLLNKSYGSSKVAIIINSTYAPSLENILFANGNYLYTNPGISRKVDNSNISLSVWVYPNKNIIANGVIAGFRNGHDTDFYIMQAAGTNTVQTGFRNSAGRLFFTTNNILVPNIWNNVVFVYNQSYITTYVNGAETNTLAANGLITNASAWFTMGAQLTSSITSNTFNGIVTNVQLYNASLSARQAYLLYSGGTGDWPLPGIADWWPLDGDTNDYVGYYYAFSHGTNPFVSEPSTPPGLQNSYQISKSAAPLIIGVNGKYNTYSVGVVAWS